MLLFAHLGITLVAGVAAAKASSFSARDTRYAGGVGPPWSVAAGMPSGAEGKAAAPWRSPSLARWLDFRLVLVGALLPDLIDKPIGGLFLFSHFHNSRIYAHTLLFCLILVTVGWLLQVRRRQGWLLSLGFGTAWHLVLDQMWRQPATLLWPAYGFGFPRTGVVDFIGWLPGMVGGLGHDPAVLVPEIAGFVSLVLFGVWLFRSKSWRIFIGTGRARGINAT